MEALRTISGKNVPDSRTLHIQSQTAAAGGGGDPLPSAPGDWTQTPISAWLASVPIVSVSRNDHTVYVRFSLKVCGSILTRRLLERNFDAKLRNQQQCFVASKNNATQGSDVSVTLLSKTSHATGAR